MSLTDYDKQSKLILNISNKLSNESNPENLDKIAKSLQQGRIGYCKGFAQECNLYGDLVSDIINSTKDLNLSPTERLSFKNKIEKIKIEIRKARLNLTKLHSK